MEDANIFKRHIWSDDNDNNDDDLVNDSQGSIKRIRLSQTSSPPEIISSSDLSLSDHEYNNDKENVKMQEEKSESDNDMKSDNEKKVKTDEENEVKNSSSDSSSESSSSSDSESELENELPSELRRELEQASSENDDEYDDNHGGNITKKTEKLKGTGFAHKKIPNIYASSNLEVLSGGQLKFSKGRNSRSGFIKIDNSIVPKLKPNYAKLNRFKQPTNISQASYKSPDEILTENYKFEANELVYLSRQEIKNYTKVELPSEEVTNSIHYYIAHRIKEKLGLSDEDFNKNYTNFLDGSALLALGAIFTKWVEDLAGKSTFKGYMEAVVDEKTSKLSSIDEFIRVYDEDASNSDDGSNSDESNEDDDTIDNGSRQKNAFSVNIKAEQASDLSSDDEILAPVRVG